MQVFHDADAAAAALPSATLTVGNYDGVHAGHAAVVARAVELAAELGRPSLAVTFRPHPAAVLSDAGAPARLTSDSQQREILGSLGLDGLLRQPFDDAFARLSPESFYGDFLRERLGASGIVVGANFRFGARRAGDVEQLGRFAAAEGDGAPRIVGVPPVVAHGDVVSSSRIRGLVSSGDVGLARELMQRPFVVEGRVVQGEGRGRTLGFPTANVETREVMIPAPGVYVSVLRLDDELLGCVTNVGRRPTFGSRPVGIETHLFDFSGNLYGERVRLAFLRRLRSEKRFAGAEELVAQVRADADAARAVLDTEPPSSFAGIPGF